MRVAAGSGAGGERASENSSLSGCFTGPMTDWQALMLRVQFGVDVIRVITLVGKMPVA